MNTPPFNLTKYSRLEKLTLTVYGEALQFPAGDRPICGNLKSLSLKLYQSNQEWASILQESSLQLSRLQPLSLQSVTFLSETIMPALFAKFHMIRHLELNDVQIRHPLLFPTPFFSDSFPNLNSFKSCIDILDRRNPLSLLFLKYRGADLFGLDIDSSVSITGPSDLEDLKRVKFMKLQRVRFTSKVAVNIIEHILETAPDIAAVCYRIGDDRPALSRQMILQRIQGILKEKKKLTDLHISAADSEKLDAVCQAIEIGLQSTRKWKRKLLRIGVESAVEMKLEETIVIITRILNRLLLCEIGEFALFHEYKPNDVCDQFWHSFGKSRREKAYDELLVKELRDLVNDIGNVELIRSDGDVFIFRKKGSRINCYKKWWNEHQFDEQVIY